MKNLSVLLCLLLTGCAGRNIGRPRVPTVLFAPAYTEAEFKVDYSAYKAAAVVCTEATPLQECTSRQLRDAIIRRIQREIDLNYNEFASDLFLGRAGAGVSLDALELGLSMAATLAGAAGSKTVFAAILSAVKGTRISFDKHFLADKSLPIIIARMGILREQVSNEMKNKMSLSSASYSLEEGLVDLTELYYSGTLPAGIQALATDMGQAAGEMKAQRSLRLQKRMK
jgi:hypothetical protein